MIAERCSSNSNITYGNSIISHGLSVDSQGNAHIQPKSPAHIVGEYMLRPFIDLTCNISSYALKTLHNSWRSIDDRITNIFNFLPTVRAQHTRSIDNARSIDNVEKIQRFFESKSQVNDEILEVWNAMHFNPLEYKKYISELSIDEKNEINTDDKLIKRIFFYVELIEDSAEKTIKRLKNYLEVERKLQRTCRLIYESYIVAINFEKSSKDRKSWSSSPFSQNHIVWKFAKFDDNEYKIVEPSLINFNDKPLEWKEEWKEPMEKYFLELCPPLQIDLKFLIKDSFKDFSHNHFELYGNNKKLASSGMLQFIKDYLYYDNGKKYFSSFKDIFSEHEIAQMEKVIEQDSIFRRFENVHRNNRRDMYKLSEKIKEKCYDLFHKAYQHHVNLIANKDSGFKINVMQMTSDKRVIGWSVTKPTIAPLSWFSPTTNMFSFHIGDLPFIKDEL